MIAKILANFVGEVYAVALLKKASEPFLKHWTYMYTVLLTVLDGQKEIGGRANFTIFRIWVTEITAFKIVK